VGVGKRFLVVRVRNEPLHQDINLTRIHGQSGRYHAKKPLGNAAIYARTR
jgi:hypothetical protein